MKTKYQIYKNGVYGCLFTLILGGAFFRLFRLGAASLQMDNFNFWDLFHRDVSAWSYFFRWHDLTFIDGQLPFAAFVGKLFIDFFKLPLTFGTMILPFAVFGILAVPVAYMAGREFGGRRMAVLLAAMTAFSPMCIQMSREAYFYSPTLLGAFLALWSTGICGRLLSNRPVPRYFHIVNAVSFFVLTWSSPSAWLPAFFLAGFNTFLFGMQLIRKRRGLVDLLILIATYLIIGLPLLIAPWGIRSIMAFTGDGAARDYWIQVFATGRSVSSWTKIWPVFSAYAWGITPLRQGFSALVVFLGLVSCVTAFRKNRIFPVLGIIFIVVLGLNIIAVQKSVWIFGITRVVSLAPFYLLLLTAGLLYPVQLLRGRVGGTLSLLLALVGFSLWIKADLLIPSMTGLPIPYAEIAAWGDTSRPAGTRVLTERSFTAYNEYRVHAPEKIQFVSTVPNQIPDLYHRFNFRAQTLRFFESYPDSAFLCEKHLWDRDDVGPWPEVLQRFARHHSINNTACVELARLGLFYRGDPALPLMPDDYVTTIYYNLPEDIVERVRRETQVVLRLYGDCWRYLKPWQPLQGASEQLMQMLWLQAGMFEDGGQLLGTLNDLQRIPQQQAMGYINQGRWADYRIASPDSKLRLFNLTEQDLTAKLSMVAIALSGNIRCRIGSTDVVFPQTLLAERSIPITLKPGENVISVSVTGNQFLLVSDVRVLPDAP